MSRWRWSSDFQNERVNGDDLRRARSVSTPEAHLNWVRAIVAGGEGRHDTNPAPPRMIDVLNRQTANGMDALT
jgi:hypothetical protein